MKILHIRKLLSFEHPTCKLLQEFLSSPEIKHLNTVEEVSYTQWKYFIASHFNAGRYERESDFWGESELLRNFFRVWILQETKLSFLLNYHKLRYQTEQAFTPGVRALELKEAKEDVFAALHGFKTIKLDESRITPHLWSLHKVKPFYMREAYFRQILSKEIEAYLEKLGKEKKGYFLTGTPLVEPKMKSLWGTQAEVLNTIKMDEGLYAVKIECGQSLSTDLDDKQVISFGDTAELLALESMGSTYSFYNFQLALLKKVRTLEESTALCVDNPIGSVNFERNISKGQNLIAEYLYESIKKIQLLFTFKDIQYNASMVQSINHLKQYVFWMNSYKKDFERFTYLFEMAFEEISLILMQTKPYQMTDYKAIMDETLKTPEIAKLNKSNFWVTSGMEALTWAMIAAGKDYPGHEQLYLTEGNYFEIRNCIKHGPQLTDQPDKIIVFNLNRSDLAVKTTLMQLHYLLEEKIKEHPLTLIVDHTLEAPVQLEHLFALLKEWLVKGQLNLILCRSQQKYTSFGLAKATGGNISILNNGSEMFKNSLLLLHEFERKSNYYINPEFQIMAHQLELSVEFEFEKKAHLKAIENANFVKKLSPKFFELVDENHAFVYFAADKGKDFGKKLLIENGIELRDSFGFLRSSYIYINNDVVKYCRINLGLESSSRLVEKFYNFQVLSEGQPNTATVCAVLEKELEQFLSHTNYSQNKVASICILQLVCLVEEESLSSHDHTLWIAKMDEIYFQFILKSPHISLEQKRNIGRLLFIYKMNHLQAQEQILQTVAEVSLRLNNRDILKSLRTLPISAQASYLIVASQIVKKITGVFCLAKEALFYVKLKRFALATQLAELCITECGSRKIPGFEMKTWLVSLFESVLASDLQQEKANFIRLKETIEKYCPEILKESEVACVLSKKLDIEFLDSDEIKLKI